MGGGPRCLKALAYAGGVYDLEAITYMVCKTVSPELKIRATGPMKASAERSCVSSGPQILTLVLHRRRLTGRLGPSGSDLGRVCLCQSQ